jgi:hypothetical protein
VASASARSSWGAATARSSADAVDARATGTVRPHGHQQSPHRQPRRDRRPHRPRLQGPRHRVRRRLCRARPGRPPRQGRRRGLCARVGAHPATPTCCRTSSSRSPSRPARTPCTPATASSPRTAPFAQKVIDAGLVWIGPGPEAIDSLGDKVKARHIALKANAPLVPGTKDPVEGPDEVVAFAKEHGLPVAIKAAYGGGGRGLKVARTLEEIPELFESAVREAVTAFGRGECFVERSSTTRGTSRPSAWPTSTATSSSSRPATARCSGATRSSSRRRRPPSSPTPSTTSWCAPPRRSSRRPATSAPAPASSSSARRRHLLPRGQHPPPGRAPVSEEVTGIDLVREQFRIADGEELATTTRSRTRTRSSSGSTARTPAAASCPRRAPSPSSSFPRARASAGTPAWSRATPSPAPSTR